MLQPLLPEQVERSVTAATTPVARLNEKTAMRYEDSARALLGV
ncbi:hypothetical protein [Streptomyces qaidamensis]|nr:hypothetical protein [Streptomyces qaidamensis]